MSCTQEAVSALRCLAECRKILATDEAQHKQIDADLDCYLSTLLSNVQSQGNA